MRFPAAIALMKAGGSIKASRLHYFDFANGEKFCWEGFGPVTTYDGKIWQGVGDVVTMEGGAQSSGTSANNLKIKLALSKDELTDPLMQATIDSEAMVYGRRYFTAIQFFGQDDQPVDRFYPTFIGVMDRISFRAGGNSREITLNIESPFVRKKTPRLEYYTDTDQKRNYPDDRFFEFISSLITKSVKWPTY
jgi:hypothetical protein